jgi:hypothetical protein
MFTIPKKVNVQQATEITIDQEQESDNKDDFSTCAHKSKDIIGSINIRSCSNNRQNPFYPLIFPLIKNFLPAMQHSGKSDYFI